MNQMQIEHRFVEFIPSTLESGVLYVSMEYGTATHLCACGCGNKVVTPITPTDWQLFYDGESVTLQPSIGNWSFPCESHYWIRASSVEWAPKWSKHMIEDGRVNDHHAKSRYFDEKNASNDIKIEDRTGTFERLKTWFKNLFKRQ